ncbi:MAG: class I SAM-dependent methyltransferase [Endomicrobium sp.]|jgi:tRNA (cmo5U34)-methyltransferase|nr:class I SAM-dependent methyltransferase [Endomicrobium sp.]
MNKATTDEIKARFDNDVKSFSNIDTGQFSFVDAKLFMEIAAESAKRLVPSAKDLLDVGSGAGNYTLKMISKIPDLNCTLLDLSEVMLQEAFNRIFKKTKKKVTTIQSDIRDVELDRESFDIILSGAALHHLRNDDEREMVFCKLYDTLRTNGCLIISDLVYQNSNVLTEYMFEMYSDYLKRTCGEKFCEDILNKIEKDDTPTTVDFQLNLMKKAGFKTSGILHKNMCFAVFGAVK